MAVAKQSSRWLFEAIVLLWIIWGYSWVVMKRALQFAGPADFAMLRTLIGTITLFGLLIALRRSLRPQALWGTILLGFLQTSCNLTMTTAALVIGDAGKVSVLNYTMPFWTILLAWIFLGEKIRGLQWLVVTLAFTGLSLILEPWRSHGVAIGEIMAVCGGLSWAAGAIVAKRMRATYDLDLLSLTAWQMLFGLIPLIINSWLMPARPIEWSGYFIFALAYAGIVATGFGWFIWLYLLNHLPAGVASLNALAIPAIAVMLAWLELSEKPALFELLGMITIAAAIVIESLYVAKRRNTVVP
jgi:drug/metabolite transporter (DMT)-like permease